MKPVGIIANPASGKDIRRLVASGGTVSHQEKINILVRLVRALDAYGVDEVRIMPDPTGIGRRVMDEVDGDLATLKVELLDMPYILGTQLDTIRAAEKMAADDYACIVVLGGDGTSRVAAKGCGEVPLLALSTGTNNVFPERLEGTLAGITAAAVATGAVTGPHAVDWHPRLELCCDGELVDIALVDLVTVTAHDIAARAVWETDTIRELFLTRAEPTTIGLSAIGAGIRPISASSSLGLHLLLGEEGTPVTAPIAPGLVDTVYVQQYATFDSSRPLPITTYPCVVALDGEREVVVTAEAGWTVRYEPRGVCVIDHRRTLRHAANSGFFNVATGQPLVVAGAN